MRCMLIKQNEAIRSLKKKIGAVVLTHISHVAK